MTDEPDDYARLINELKSLPLVPPQASPFLCGVAIVAAPALFLAVVTALVKLMGTP